jgi:hypothetical protein
VCPSPRLRNSEQVQVIAAAGLRHRPIRRRPTRPRPPWSQRARPAARGDKLYLDALDYYRAALGQATELDSGLLNKIGITEPHDAAQSTTRCKAFERAIKATTAHYADAYNNRGVVYYESNGDTPPPFKQYRKGDCARTAQFGVLLQQPGSGAYSPRNRIRVRRFCRLSSTRWPLDPDVFERTSRAGVQAQLPSPRGSRPLRLHRGASSTPRWATPTSSLEYLKKAMEAGYKDLKNVSTRTSNSPRCARDKRFAELMAANTPASVAGISVPDYSR